MIKNKAQGMSLKVIIIGVLALVMVVVLLMIFTGKAKIFVNQTSSTEDQYSADKCEIFGTALKCRTDSGKCSEMGGYVVAQKSCPEGQICCSQ